MIGGKEAEKHTQPWIVRLVGGCSRGLCLKNLWQFPVTAVSAPPTKRWIPTLCETLFNRYLWNSQSTWKVEVFESQLFFNFGSRWVISEFSMRIFGAIFCRYFYVKRWRDQTHIIFQNVNFWPKNGQNAHFEFGEDPSRPKIEKLLWSKDCNFSR